jgi:DNA-directed RNA polymerase specialized sigma24 family protein
MEKPPLSEIIHECQKENARYRKQREKGARGSCYELFHRAVTGDNLAWTAIYEQYHRLVAKWVGGSIYEMEDRTQAAFEKFLRSINPDTFLQKFPDIERIMGFLCTISKSVKLDAERIERREAILLSFKAYPELKSEYMLDQIIDNILSNELWQKILGQLNDEQEKTIMELSFHQGFTPRQIVEQCPDQFQDVTDVHRIKERVLLRLKSNPLLQSWWRAQN